MRGDPREPGIHPQSFTVVLSLETLSPRSLQKAPHSPTPTSVCPFDCVNGILRKNYTPLHFPANLPVTAMVPNIIKIVQTPSQMSLSNFLASRGGSAKRGAGLSTERRRLHGEASTAMES